MDLILKDQIIILCDACETSFHKMRTYSIRETYTPPTRTSI